MSTATQIKLNKFQKSPLSKINSGRKLAAALLPILMKDESRLRDAGYNHLITSLEDYEKAKYKRCFPHKKRPKAISCNEPSP